MKNKFLINLFAVLISLTVFSQRDSNNSPSLVSSSVNMYKVEPLEPRLSNLKIADFKQNKGLYDSRSSRHKVIPGKGSDGDDILAASEKPMSQKYQVKSIDFTFNSGSFNQSGGPTDPAGAVGPNHYVIISNAGFRIYNKLGNPATNWLDYSAIFDGNNLCCDPTVSYDHDANRFVMTVLADDGVHIAVSGGPNPLGGWNVYEYDQNTDYQKLSVWGDGYYFTANKFGGSKVYAVDKEAMIQGASSADIQGFDLPGLAIGGFYSPQALNAINDDLSNGPASIVYYADDAWSGVSYDHLKIWYIDVDWNNPSNSSISNPQVLETTPFISVFDQGSFSNLEQPGSPIDIDAIQGTIMNQAQFRKFPNYNSAVFNFVVDTDGSANEIAGIRWYEIRQDSDNSPWYIFQEGTYTSPNGKHAWLGSMGIDMNGNIAMGYSGMGGTTNTYVSSYYTGRFENDPLGVMTIEETLLDAGGSNISGTNRYGDYAKLALDPSNQKDFWFITENKQGSQISNPVGVFQIVSDNDYDLGVVDIPSPTSSAFSGPVNITASIYNYGQSPVSNFNIYYQVDGGSQVVETYIGTVVPLQTVNYTFSNAADLSNEGQTYSIEAGTLLSNDQDNNNNSYAVDVTHLAPFDVGISSVVSPTDGTLSNCQEIIVEVTNYGGNNLNNVEVTLEFGSLITTSVLSSISAGDSIEFTLDGCVDMVIPGDYTFTVYTSYPGDGNSSNDSLTVSVTNVGLCAPESDCSFGDGMSSFEFADISNLDSGCSDLGYGNYTDLSTDLLQGETYDMTFSTGYGSQVFRVWIDYNDDFVFSLDELIVDNPILAQGQAAGNYSGSLPITIPASASLGEHLMRVKSNWQSGVPDDACEATEYGETEDYTVNIINSLGMDDLTTNSNLSVFTNDNKEFNITLTSDFYGTADLTVFDVTGKRIIFHRFNKETATYEYDLDMSYMSAGVYLVKVGNSTFGKIKKIIVK